jgi:hypothetical protein
MIIEQIVIGKPTGTENTYALTPGYMEPGPCVRRGPDEKKVFDTNTPGRIKKVLGNMSDPDLFGPGSVVFSIVGNMGDPIVYVTDPTNVICGSCRTDDARMKYLTWNNRLECPKCGGGYDVVETYRSQALMSGQKVFDNR